MKKLFALFLALTISFSQATIANDVWLGENFSGFKKLNSVSGKNFMISSADEAASKAGKLMIEKGGNAVDAAIAAELVLSVVEPHSSGLGGGGLMLIFDKKTGGTIFLNGRETAPIGSYASMFLDKNSKPREFSDVVRGGLSVGTPGLLKMLKEAHSKYGKLPWSDLFTPAIEAAQNGFKVNQRMRVLSMQIPYLQDFPETAEIYLNKNGLPYEVGDVIKNPKLAHTLEVIAKEGVDPFYNGAIAKDIVKAVRSSKINPGTLSLADLRSYKAKNSAPLCATYRVKYKICSAPLPSSGGVTLLQILGILENFDLTEYDPESAETVHLIAEATRLAYADRNEYLASDTNEALVRQMLDKIYLRKRSKLINLQKAMEKVEAGQFNLAKNEATKPLKIAVKEPISTTHISVIDKEGNAVAITSSIEYFFGSALTVDGFLLNNQLTDFSLVPAINGKFVANRVQPGKQPLSSMAPTFVFDENDKLLMVVGSPGGPRIIQFVLKTILNHLDWEMDIQEAISEPNFVAMDNKIELEKNTSIVNLRSELEKMNHKVELVDIVSGIHAIAIEDEHLKGAADPRRGGIAVGR